MSMDYLAGESKQSLERYRHYLRLLAQVQINPGLQGRLDASDIVQQTLLEAHEKRAQFRGASEGEWLGWLRQILAHNLTDAIRGARAAKRDLGRERSLEEALEHSSVRLEHWLGNEQSSPSQRAQRHERALRLAEAMAALPESQRQALVLRYFQGWPLGRIGEQLDRSHAAVAGLLKRGLEQLRTLLADQGER
jgi:RNA polymerase sigma-70 factor (ECF subfamily)